MVDSSKYVVLDLETNGLSSHKDDLLSISIFKPDTQNEYTKFLPLEKNTEVVTSHINGITKSMLIDATPLTQDDVDELIYTFELNDRTILTYGELDENFINRYFTQHNLHGNENWKFFNFKRNILSSDSVITLSKDNLCKFFNIKGVKNVHSGINDCILEWKLFEKLDNCLYLVSGYKIFKLYENLLFPARLVPYYKNLKYHKNIPTLDITTKVVYTYQIPSDTFKNFKRKIPGYHFEEALFYALNAQRNDTRQFSINNNLNIKYIGDLTKHVIDESEVFMGIDGLININSTVDAEEFEFEKCDFLEELAIYFKDFASYLKTEILKSDSIIAKETIIDNDNKICALCDLSTNNSIIDINPLSIINLEDRKYDLFYKAKGRKIYLLTVDWWHYDRNPNITFELYEVEISQNRNIDSSLSYTDNIKNAAREKLQQKLNDFDLDIIAYTTNKEKMTLKCRKCGGTFSRFPKSMKDSSHPACPLCK